MISKEHILEAEKAKMNWFDRAFRRYPQIQTTNILSTPIDPKTKTITLHPSWFDKILSAIFILFASVFFVPLFNLLFTDKEPFLIPLIGIFFVLFIISVAIWFSFFNPEYIFTIRITPEYLEAKNEQHKWVDIAETYILRKMEGRFENKYLILAKKDSSLIQLNLFKFKTRYRRIAGLVEFFKNITPGQHRCS